MKKINELKAERASLIDKMDVISRMENISDEQQTEWTNMSTEIEAIDNKINMLERQEQLNKQVVRTQEVTPAASEEVKSLGVQFREFFVNAIEEGKKATFRVEPMLSTSNTDILNKTVKPVDVLVSPGEEFLKGLGVTFYKGINGNLVLPSMEQNTAGFISENTCGTDASMNIQDITLSPRRITNYQSVTREFLAQTNPDIYQTLLNQLIVGLWNGVVEDFFDVVDTDAATRIKTLGHAPTYNDVLGLEASVGCYNINPQLVTSPTGKAYYKGLNAGNANIKFAWDGNEMNGYTAKSHCAANTNKTYFGDWSHAAVGQWGGIEIIVDPYTKADCGIIKVTALGLFDAAISNKNAFAIIDGSLA